MKSITFQSGVVCGATRTTEGLTIEIRIPEAIREATVRTVGAIAQSTGLNLLPLRPELQNFLRGVKDFYGVMREVSSEAPPE